MNVDAVAGIMLTRLSLHWAQQANPPNRDTKVALGLSRQKLQRMPDSPGRASIARITTPNEVPFIGFWPIRYKA